MKKIAKYNVSKGTQENSQSGGNSSLVINRGSSDVDHATNADNATHAAEADKAALADKATEADHAASATTLDEDSQVFADLDNKYLRKDQPDETKFKLTMGEAEVKGALTVGGEATVDTLHSKGFSKGTGQGFDGTGFGIWTDTDGRSNMELDNLIVRMRMIIAELEVHEMTYIGGSVVLSPCGNRIDFVKAFNKAGEDVTKEGVTDTAIAYYRCYFLANDDEREVKNEWCVGQFGRCKTNNIHTGTTENYTNQDYWRLCTAVATEKAVIEGKEYWWFDLSNSTEAVTLSWKDKDKDGKDVTKSASIEGVDKDLNSVPKAGDKVIGLGHLYDATRQNAAIFDATGNIGWTLYKGIKTYALSDDYVVNKFSVDETIVTTDHYLLRPYAQKDETTTVVCMRGAYDAGKYYGHNDLVTYNGQVYICLVKVGDSINGIAPDDKDKGALNWAVYTAKGADGKDGTAGTSINMKTGVTSTDDLPKTGASMGDSYIIGGHLWTYTGATASDSTHINGFTDCGQVSGEAGKNNYVHVAWSNVKNPTLESDIVLSNTGGNAYAYMGTWVSETKDDKAAEAMSMATWVYVKGDKGDTPTVAKLRVNYSACHFSRTSNTWDHDSVTVTIVIMDGSKITIPAYGDTSRYYWRLSTDSEDTMRSSSMGFSASLNASSITVNLYKTGDDSNVPLDTITVPMVFDGAPGTSDPGTPATVYTIEPCANFEATGRLKDASTIEVSITGDVIVYKKTGDQAKVACGAGQGVYTDNCRLSILDNGSTETNYDGSNAFRFENDAKRIKVIYSNDITISTDKNNIPGSATIAVYDLIDNGKVGNQLASLVVPISMNAGAIQEINKNIGEIRNTTVSKNDFNTTIETIKQGQGEINLKVQAIERRSMNILAGGNVEGTYTKKNEAWRSKTFSVEKGKTYTVTAKIWKEKSDSHIMKFYVVRSDSVWENATTRGSGQYSNTSSSVVRFKFAAGATRDMYIDLFEMTSDEKDPGFGNYNGVHIDWCRVDDGDWTGDEVLDKWEPAASEVDALNLLPDPAFENGIAYSDAMGERNSWNWSDRKMGSAVDGMYKDGTRDGDGACGVLFNRSGSNSYTADGLRYIVPFRGPGTYSISYFIKDMHQTDTTKPSWDDGMGLYMECHPMNADKERITGGFSTGGFPLDDRFGDERHESSHTFGDTATHDNGNGTTTEMRIAYLEVLIFLQKNGCVRVSRMCLSKSDHYTYWNAAEVSEERKKELGQLATGIDIFNKKIMLTSDKTVFQTNSGKEVAVFTGEGINADLIHARELTTVDPSDGHGVTIQDAMAAFFGKKGVANIKFGVNNDGYAVLSYYDNGGKFLYDLGPNGISAKNVKESSINSEKAIAGNVIAGKEGYSFSTSTRSGYAYCAPTDYEYLIFGGKEADHSAAYFSEGYTPTALSGSTMLYQYHAAYIGGTAVKDDTFGLSTPELANEADGKWFTSNSALGNGSALINLADGVYFTASYKTGKFLSDGNTYHPYMAIVYAQITSGVMETKTLYTYEFVDEVVKTR